MTSRAALAAALAIASLAAAPSPARADVLVTAGSTATHRANATDPGIAMTWTAETFDDTTWAVGTYGMGYETGTGALALIQTTVPTSTVSLYTRTRFTVPDPTAVRGLLLGCDYDDGVIAWINGVEVWRSPEMPAGAPAWNTNPRQHESSNAAAPVFTPLVDISAAGIPALRAGVNVLAIAVWNADLPSSDLVLVPHLVANPEPTVTRGPYLQMATPDAMTIRWRTTTATDSVVRWGDAPGNLLSAITRPGARTEHEVRITGLQPATRYHYSVGMTGATLAGDDAGHAFTTPPLPGVRAPLRAWVVGDSGTANAAARRVRDAFVARDGGRAPDFWLMLGDNAYDSGTDPEYQRAVFETYPEQLRQSCVWPTFGNHDALSADGTTQSGVYFDAFTLPAAAQAGGVPSGTEAYYSFDWANVHFACLDSQDSSRSATGAQADWLRRDLAATTREWIIAYFHHPPYTKGSHDSDVESRHIDMRQQILPILEDFGVDLILSGHSHSYERSFLIDGHYGDSTTLVPANILDGGDGRIGSDGAYFKARPGLTPHLGEVCVVAGSSGKLDTGPFNHPAMFISLEVLGSFIVDVSGDRLDGTFLDDANVVRDTFTIIKQSASVSEVCGNGVDDDGDTLADCADPECAVADGDGDGEPDCTDCAPADPGTRVPPGDVTDLRVAKPAGGSTDAVITWADPRAAAGGGTVADVATGVITEMLADAGLARASCLATGLSGTGPAVDPRRAAASSDGFWYLTRARNACAAAAWAGGAAPSSCP